MVAAAGIIAQELDCRNTRTDMAERGYTIEFTDISIALVGDDPDYGEKDGLDYLINLIDSAAPAPGFLSHRR